MSREEFERSVPRFLSGLKIYINSIPTSSKTHIGLDRPPGETVIYVEDMANEGINEFIDWGKVRISGVHRVSQIFKKDVYSEKDLCGSDYAYCEFLGSKTKVTNEETAFSSRRCSICGRTEYAQTGDIAVKKKLGDRPFYVTASCDLIVGDKLSKIFSGCGVNVRGIKGPPGLFQVFPLSRFRFSRDVRHQNCHNHCGVCGEHLGVIFNACVEGNWRPTGTSDLRVTHSNRPIVVIVPGGSIGRDQMFQAPQSLFGNLAIPAPGAVVRPYGRHEMKTSYILSGELLRRLRDEIGWRSLRECISTPAMLKGNAPVS